MKKLVESNNGKEQLFKNREIQQYFKIAPFIQ